MRLGFADAGNDDPSTTSRQAYELTEQGFGAGANGPLIVATVGTEAEAEAAYTLVAGTEGVAFATPPEASPDGEMFTSLAFPTTSPQAEETEDLVHTLRAELGDAHLVGGATAAAIDFAEAVSDRMLLFMGAVVGLSALLLLLVFGSVVVAVKAAILNLISIGASLGVMKLVFQDGRLWARAGPDRGVRAGDDLRDRVRPVDGLRGLPDLPDARGVEPHRRRGAWRSAKGWPTPAG